MRIFLTIFIIIATGNSIVLAQENIEPEATRYDYAPADTETHLFGILEAYDTYFEQASNFGWSFVRFRPRGYEWRYRGQRIGGIRITDWLRGGPAWNAMNGLSAAGVETLSGAIEIPHSVGRNADLDIAPWRQQRGGRLSLSTGNRSYTFRGLARYASGENQKNSWSYSLFGSGSFGKSYTTDGVWNESWSAFAAVAKRLGDHHRISLTAFHTPTKRALQSASTAEAFSLTGNNLYNPTWGPYGGKQRSANVRDAGQPVFMLSHEYKTEQLRTVTTVAARFGQESYSALNWQNAPNPRPDYYRNMPSFQSDETMREQLADLWRTDQNVRQIDWQALTDLNARDARAHYIVEERVRDYIEYTVQSVADRKISDHTTLYAGIDLLWADNLNFKRVKDLLGADHWLDVDSFVEHDDDVGNKTQSNVRTPNRQVREGDRFGYKYTMETVTGRLWAGVSHQKNNLNLNLTLSGGAAGYRRFGYYEKENFPGERSYRYSERLIQPEWLAQADAGYKIGGRFQAGLKITAQSLAPLPRNSFISPEYRNAILPDLKNEQVLSAELRFDYRHPDFALYLTGFMTQFTDRTEVRYFYDDFNHFYCNYIMEGIDTRHMGVELSAEITLTDHLKLNLAGVWMDNRHTSNPFAAEWKDATGTEILTERVHYTGLKVANGPQTAATVNLVYAPRSWTFSTALNGYGNNYIAITPLRRTQRSTERASTTADKAEMSEQESLGGGMTVDVFLGKTIYLRNNNRLGVYAGINNVFNRQNIRTGGYESSRMRTDTAGRLKPLDSKYYYGLGINFFLTASWRF